MSTTPQRSKHQLRVTSYDRVSSWIVSLLVVMGVLVGSLLVIYISSKLISHDFAIPVTPVSSGGGGTGGIGGAAGDNEPDSSSADEQTAFDEPQMQDTLTAVTSAVTTRTNILDDEIDLSQTNEKHGDNRTPGFGGGRGGGIGGGIGSGFGPGRGGPPPPDRAIRFEPKSLLEFAQWLDFFEIELGVLDQVHNKIYYAKNLAQPKPSVREGDPSKPKEMEDRIPMTPTDYQFIALDKELAKKAGIADKGEIIVQFYPAKTMALLIELEQKHAGARKPETIRGTTFRVTHTGNQFQFSVIDQQYRY
jgi:hypothetical protein